MTTVERIGRLAGALLLLILGGGFAFWGVFIAAKVFDDYKDSSDVTYLTIGGALTLIGLALAASAVLLARGERRGVCGWWGALSVALLLLTAVLVLTTRSDSLALVAFLGGLAAGFGALTSGDPVTR
ncbi:MAG TPA: hypothetical protein VI759_03430 [Dehalococcoidia bacterium]|nr:hypothetical protein [Dehalococcoidia bacterium]